MSDAVTHIDRLRVALGLGLDDSWPEIARAVESMAQKCKRLESQMDGLSSDLARVTAQREEEQERVRLADQRVNAANGERARSVKAAMSETAMQLERADALLRICQTLADALSDEHRRVNRGSCGGC
jgi:chromosome segregation ATPase